MLKTSLAAKLTVHDRTSVNKKLKTEADQHNNLGKCHTRTTKVIERVSMERTTVCRRSKFCLEWKSKRLMDGENWGSEYTAKWSLPCVAIKMQKSYPLRQRQTVSTFFLISQTFLSAINQTHRLTHSVTHMPFYGPFPGTPGWAGGLTKKRLIGTREQPLDFYEPDVLPATQHIMPKHYEKTWAVVW